MQRNIVLIGMMGTGKSTVGRALAARLGWTFVDTDHEIEAEHGLSIPEMFAQLGEPVFRQAESRVLESVLSQSRQVVSTGGGAVLAAANREVMQNGNLVVALTADADTIISRVRSDQNRPLLQGDVDSQVRGIMERRRGAYDFAPVVLDTSRAAVEELVEQIMDRLARPLEDRSTG